MIVMASRLNRNAKALIIKEQIFEDASGITFQFIVTEDTPDFPFRIRMYGDILPFGNRELTIGKDGVVNGGGTALGPLSFDKD
jgi:hypothetical protein